MVVPSDSKPLQSIRLVKEAGNGTIPRTPSPLPPSYLPLLQISPYSKEPPDWEVKRSPVKVLDIVAHFEHLNKIKDSHFSGDGSGGSNSSRNESRSSGIFSDFEEDHDSLVNTNSRSCSPQKNNDVDHVTPTTTPIPVPRKLCFTPPDLEMAQEIVDKVIATAVERVGEIEKEFGDDDTDAEGREDEDEVTYGVEEINNNAEDYNHSHYSSDNFDNQGADGGRSLFSKLFSFSVLLYLLVSGGSGAILLGLRLSPGLVDDVLSKQVVNIPGELVTDWAQFLDLSKKSGDIDALPLLLVGAITLKFLGWYFIFRKSLFRRRSNFDTGFLNNCLLAMFQPGLFLISRFTSTHAESISDDTNLSESEDQFDPENAQFEESSENDDPAYKPFSFDSALDSEDSSQTPRGHTNTLLLIVMWLSLIQVTSIALSTYLLVSEIPLVEGFLIFGQLPQLLIFLALALISRLSESRHRKME